MINDIVWILVFGQHGALHRHALFYGEFAGALHAFKAGIVAIANQVYGFGESFDLLQVVICYTGSTGSQCVGNAATVHGYYIGVALNQKAPVGSAQGVVCMLQAIQHFAFVVH